MCPFSGEFWGGADPKKIGRYSKKPVYCPGPDQKMRDRFGPKIFDHSALYMMFSSPDFFSNSKTQGGRRISASTITFYPAPFFRGVFPKKFTKILISRARIIIFWNGFQQNVLWILFYRLEQKSNKNHHPSSTYVVFSRKNSPVAASPCLALWHYY